MEGGDSEAEEDEEDVDEVRTGAGGGEAVVVGLTAGVEETAEWSCLIFFAGGVAGLPFVSVFRLDVAETTVVAEEVEGRGTAGGKGVGTKDEDEDEEDAVGEDGVEVVATGEVTGAGAAFAFTLSFHCAMILFAVSRTAATSSSLAVDVAADERVSLLTSTPICVCCSTCAVMSWWLSDCKRLSVASKPW